ncbi:DUF2312 domain-containing protein [Rhodovarius crocodyli]|uniref:DUF2312 domain-containing protein n=1 Tax=Rhodovarius crocodyli TaxID=1979269 RepID=A0A437M1C6_9PROT|nr:DUF2312 domain-containing protein [Rhodovarius crocodyli]RVT91385.1 DUF2312 domain-containing protein [Rhodovarius crocodyli]
MSQTDLEDDYLGGRNPENTRKGNLIAAERLRSLVERIERLLEERAAIGSDIKDIYAEAKSAGFCPKTIKIIVAQRKKDAAEIEELETLRDLYRRALGM